VNTGNVPLSGITQGVLGGTAPNPANYLVTMNSTCGPAGAPNAQTLGVTSLGTQNPGNACTVQVQFRPLTGTANPVGVKPATVSVTYSAVNSAGTATTTTLTSTLNGNAQ
jgi:hypothetical protein